MRSIVAAKILSTLVITAQLTACAVPSKPATTEPTTPQSSGQVLIIDTHIDAPYRMYKTPTDLGVSSEVGQFDYPKARAGGLGTGFMSIFIPPEADQAGTGLSLAHQLIDLVEGSVNAHPDRFVKVTCPADVRAAFKKGLVGLAMGMENGGPVANAPDELDRLFERGVRYIGLAHSKTNALADSSYDPQRPHSGLSPAGHAMIRDMNRLGIMVDVSHVSDDAFWHIIAASRAPVIASHSSMRHFIPGFERNLDDRMVEAIVRTGGVVQINVGSSFLTVAARQYEAGLMTAVKAELVARSVAADSPVIKDFVTRYRAEHPYPYATLDDVIDHIDHVVKIGGINGVGIGSDFDGVGDSLSEGLKSVADYPNLIRALQRRGYSTRAIRKIMGENLLRTWQAVERYASERGTRPHCTL